MFNGNLEKPETLEQQMRLLFVGVSAALVSYRNGLWRLTLQFPSQFPSKTYSYTGESLALAVRNALRGLGIRQ